MLLPDREIRKGLPPGEDDGSSFEYQKEQVPVHVCEVKSLDGLEGMEELYNPAIFRSMKDAEPFALQKAITIKNSSKAIEIGW